MPRKPVPNYLFAVLFITAWAPLIFLHSHIGGITEILNFLCSKKCF